MARPIQIDVNRVAQARRTVKATRNLDDFKSALAVLLPAKAGLTLEATARLLGVGTSSVNRMQARFQIGRASSSERRNWGGRRGGAGGHPGGLCAVAGIVRHSVPEAGEAELRGDPVESACGHPRHCQGHGDCVCGRPAVRSGAQTETEAGGSRASV